MWATVAAGVTVLLWASAFVAIRFVGKDFSAGSLTLGRLISGVIALSIFLIVRKAGRKRESGPAQVKFRPTGREWWLLILCGLAWFGVYNVALNAAEQVLDAGTTSMLVNVGPVLIALFAGLFLGEGFPRLLLIGISVSLAGAVIIGFASSSGKDVPISGVLLTLLAATVYAIGVVAQKPVLRRLPALEVTLVAASIGGIACLPFLPTLLRELGEAHTSSILWLIYLGVFPTAIAFTTWAYALARSTAGKLGSTMYLVPPLAILMGWIFLGETPALLAYVGGVVCLTGVAIAKRKPKVATPAA
ncbi:EamA/RhaT family transporter [Nakamurella silvestris]|nr:EamA/RhaT family transporter [Nakamurella silvestris]